MNLTQIIEETGKRIRLGKPHADKLTNIEIKEVLDTALAILQEGLLRDGRVEIQDFAVIEIITTTVKKGGQLKPFGDRMSDNTSRTGIRRRWVFRPAQALRRVAKRIPTTLTEAKRDIDV